MNRADWHNVWTKQTGWLAKQTGWWTEWTGRWTEWISWWTEWTGGWTEQTGWRRWQTGWWTESFGWWTEQTSWWTESTMNEQNSLAPPNSLAGGLNGLADNQLRQWLTFWVHRTPARCTSPRQHPPTRHPPSYPGFPPAQLGGYHLC